MELTQTQIKILLKMMSGCLVLTGAESDEDRLALLQLYTIGYVKQQTNQKNNIMEWHITERGKAVIHI